jgi:hypothetical protein
MQFALPKASLPGLLFCFEATSPQALLLVLLVPLLIAVQQSLSVSMLPRPMLVERVA